MDQQDLIKQAIEEEQKEATEKAEKTFKSEVRAKIREIEDLSEELRRAKKDLAEMTYEPPKDPSVELPIYTG